MSYKLILLPDAEQDLDEHIKAGNKLLLKKIYRLFEELATHPDTGTGKPEYLKHLSLWSRRINDKHRMLYKIDGYKVTVFVLSLWGHYDDK
ncbi:MAG: Txe/YoeB family addiction module toxin [Tannerella sp.]|jgi:toxin YoeB|nr:Txe/YoeB family addiction module toxin [Tannerella sp.]